MAPYYSTLWFQIVLSTVIKIDKGSLSFLIKSKYYTHDKLYMFSEIRYMYYLG